MGLLTGMMAGIMWPMQKHSLTLHSIALLLALLASPAWAQTGPPPGSQPLYARLEEIRKEQLALTQIIQSPKTGQQQKAQAVSKYQQLEAYKQAIQEDIARLQRTGRSNFLKDPEPGKTPGTTSPAPSSGQR